MLKITTKAGGQMFKFDSMSEVVRFTNPKLFAPRSASFVGERLATWTDVEKRSSRVWAEGMYTIGEFVKRLRDSDLQEIKSHKRRTNFNETEGDEIDFDRLRAGQPFWRKSEREETTAPPTATVVIDTTTAADVETTDILWRGAAAIALTQILEEKGYSVELWVVNGSQLYSGSSKGIMTACCLKRPGDPLDTSTIINQVAGWFYRTVTFTLLDTICRTEGKSVAYGYGACYTPTNDDLSSLSIDAHRIYAAGVFTFNGALSVIKAELAEFGSKT